MLGLTDGQFNDCWEEFHKLEDKALTMNHYQLARNTHIEDPIIWKAFLTDPRVRDHIQSEMDIIINSAISEIVKNAPNSNSVGQAQLVNSLLKVNETTQVKDGPTFIYCYVPLNDEQKFAPNVEEIELEKEEDNEEWELTNRKLDKANTSHLSRRGRELPDNETSDSLL